MHPVLDKERVDFLNAKVNPERHQQLPQWVRPEKSLPVVELQIEWVRFSTLNHRTRAEQMKQQHKSGNNALFKEDPLGALAQEAQLNILKSQENFEDLMNDLRERGQQEPAIVTADGVLINGNRRAAAMRSLWEESQLSHARYIRALVLPDDATIDELIDLETELQVSKHYKEEYSWVNEALLIEEISNSSNRDLKKVARRMRLSEDKVLLQFEKLQLLHQLVSLSDGKRYHAEFVDNESAFEELAKYARGKSPEEVASVRNIYFMGILSGVRYRQLRHLRRGDAAAFVSDEFTSEPEVSAIVKPSEIKNETDNSSSLLDDVLGGKDVTNGDGLQEGVLALAKLRPEEVIESPGGEDVSGKNVIEAIRGAIEAAASEASEVSRDAKIVAAPIRYLSVALETISRVPRALPKARIHGDWNEDDFVEKLNCVKKAISDIEEAP